MRTIAIMCLVLATALAGCSGDGESLSEFTVKKGDVSGFVYTPIPAEEKSDAFPRNPGPMDVSDLSGMGITGMYVSVLSLANSTEELAIQSAAMRFSNTTNAEMGVEMLGACSEDSMIAVGGTTVAIVTVMVSQGSDDYENVHDQAHDAFHAILERTGAEDYCMGAEGADH